MVSQVELSLSRGNSRVRLRPKSIEDAWKDYLWKLDPELASLDAIEPFHMGFGEYYDAYVEELEHPQNFYFHFAVETIEGRHIGNCMLYDINTLRGDAQLGILIGDRDYWNRGYGSEAVSELLETAFKEADIKRLYLNTLRDNVRAQKCFSKIGFRTVGKNNKNGHDFIVMEIYRFQRAQKEGDFSPSA
ncbi:MAG: GNAT family N-acetyltransferase [Dehalococcoidia bacterium]|nr:GNAT family N-acetyltransferase [Dehalococcoidia bacterium]